MTSDRLSVVEDIQRLTATLIATSPAGHKLCLIGGFRYRLLSRSCRMSLDIDYHWDGGLDGKQVEIADLLRAKLLPEVKRRLGYDGNVGKATGPDADSPFVKTVVLAFYRTGEAAERIEIPVEITKIPCTDPPIVNTVAGTVYLTASDADMIEGKVIALFNRTFVEGRDIIDLFLFQDQLVADAAKRLKAKLGSLHITSAAVADRYAKLLANRRVHVRAIDAIIEDQIDTAVAVNLKAAGGGGMVFDTVVAVLKNKVGL